ncbi:unnamed protein product [Linum tenue]|uniref:CCHC-type domain-containing protein n=1 Tax=Linum tenue TaxID=586396 RepID=A0AAV0Q6H3_9ROSI|nr:unnamed protein product [Linum tenue]
MLSSAPGETFAPPPAPFPSDRPPDTAPAEVASTGADMIVDPSPSSTVANQLVLIQASDKVQQPFSYAKAVLGLQNLQSNPQSAATWTPVGEHDLIRGEKDGEPALSISPEFKHKICAPWQRSLVVRLLGIKIGFMTLCSRLRGLWKPSGTLEIRDLDYDCFLVKMDNEQDYFRALTEGPWMIFDHYLLVQQWSPNFKVSDPLPKTMIVWAQLPALKIHFYHREVLTTLGNLLGRAIKLDYHTLNQERAKFARIAVEVDLSKPLVPRIWLDDAWQRVEYENLPQVCFHCGKIGHTAESCPHLRSVSVSGARATANGTMPESTPIRPPEENSGFGPWMLVSRRSRRGSRDGQKKGISEPETALDTQGKSNKNGKGGVVIREREDLTPQMPKPTGNSPQREISNGKKNNNGKKGSEVSRKGKEKLAVETSTVKGVLGPGPGRQRASSSELKIREATERVSTVGSHSAIMVLLGKKLRPLRYGQLPARTAPFYKSWSFSSQRNQ